MKNKIWMTLIAVVCVIFIVAKAEAVQSDEADLTVKGGLPDSWTECEKDSDCTTALTDCYRWQPVNVKHVAWLQVSKACTASVDPGFMPVVACVKKRCAATDEKTTITMDDWNHRGEGPLFKKIAGSPQHQQFIVKRSIDEERALLIAKNTLAKTQSIKDYVFEATFDSGAYYKKLGNTRTDKGEGYWKVTCSKSDPDAKKEGTIDFRANWLTRYIVIDKKSGEVLDQLSIQ